MCTERGVGRRRRNSGCHRQGGEERTGWSRCAPTTGSGSRPRTAGRSSWVTSATSELKEFRQLREESRKLKQLVADLSLDKTILREALTKRF